LGQAQLAKGRGTVGRRNIPVLSRLIAATEKETNMKRQMECCVCGRNAGRWTQHWNRDNGYGCCAKCIGWMRGRNVSETEIENLYGKEGVNWGAPATLTNPCDVILDPSRAQLAERP
jgi:hypothetical protein